MNKLLPLSLITAIAAISLLGCQTNRTGSSLNQPVTIALNTSEKNIVSSDNSFGLRLFSKINEGEQNKNVFISPFSVSMAFGMLLNGANGATLDSLEQTLGDAGLSLDNINNGYKDISSFLTTLDPDVTVQNANSIWYRNGMPVLSDFLNTNKNYFDADVSGLDFSQPGAAQTINNWVDTKTNGKIPTIISDAIPSDIEMYLINAIYFKGAWTNTFDSSVTQNAQFTCADGSTASCRLMHQENIFAYYGDSSLQAIDLPYGNRSFSMTVILPAAGTSIDQFAASLTQTQWNAIVNKLDSAKVQLFLPKFTLNYFISLKSVLSALGMGIAFDPMRADLSGISTAEKLFVSDVLHKTYVEVDEQGTEAAAVTAIIVGTVVIKEPPVPVMRIDHPFIFAIRERQTGTILFIGKADSLAG
jgi:serine protease inhibitor